INVSPDGASPNKNSIFSDEELRTLEKNLPSEYQPFEGLKFPLSANQFRPRDDNKNKSKRGSLKDIETQNGKKRFIALPDRLGLSSRLSLYDAKHQFVVGEPPSSDQM
ncbi:sensor histidine kinase efflux regulator BaeS, partial [Acinetobacter baumannii]